MNGLRQHRPRPRPRRPHGRLTGLTLGLSLLLAACSQPVAPDLGWRFYARELGDPVPGLDAETAASYERGREVADRAFTPSTGLGPTFNADSCASCHQLPVTGGAAPRYRDFFLVKEPRWDGALVDAGTNGQSPVRNLYSLTHGHEPASPDIEVWARRNAPPMFGVGLFAFVSDAEILKREDPFDANGDGISGRANYESDRLGRFGYKAQAASMESFNRGAMFNQMGITSDPLFFDLDEPALASLTPAEAAGRLRRSLPAASDALDVVFPRAWAQVSAPNEPTVDDDGAPDPEMTNDEQRDLLVFSTYIAPPTPTAPDAAATAGAEHFRAAGCTSCHVPRLESDLGPLAAYTDLLLHDMGPELADGITPGYADSEEFRTAPLWGVALTAPFLHDGRAETLDEAILAHGGEGSASRDAYAELDPTAQAELLAFLRSLGPYDAENQGFTTPSHPEPGVGELGGPDVALTGEELAAFNRGRLLFDRHFDPSDGADGAFNADTCRACHQDPVLGGAGGLDVNVVRMGSWFGDPDNGGTFESHGLLHRAVRPGALPTRALESTTTYELRQAPSLLGIGQLDTISNEAILANADPDDADGDGIRGRARWVGDRVGRYGWKAQIATIPDFVADALLVEVGVTLDPTYSTFTRGDDDDDIADPELPTTEADDLATWLAHLAPPPPTGASEPEGEAAFRAVGCADCHVPELDGVRAYTDLLLHDVVPPGLPLVDQDPEAPPGWFRTPPLWGVRDTAPYLHDGRAESLHDAILGHDKEARPSREAYEALPEDRRAALIRYLESL